MADYHSVYKDVEGTTTEWEDLQVKHGNWEARPKPENVAWEPAQEQQRPGDRDDELDLEGEEEDTFMEEYRRRRMEELKAASLRPQFGSVELIKGADFVREVTNASQQAWVVVHLFQEGVSGCALLGRSLDDLASKFRGTKFVRIVSTDCIPNYPDASLPTLLVYKGGQVQETLVGLLPYSLPGMSKASPQAVALALCKVGPVLSGPDESEEEVMQRVRKEVVLGMVEHHSKRTTDKDEEDEDE